MRDAAGLTPQQRLYVNYRVSGYDDVTAKKMAGYTHKSTVHTVPHVKRAIQMEMAASGSRAGALAERLAAELANIAFSDPRNVMSWGPDGVVLKDSSTLTEDEAKLVAEVGETISPSGGSIKVKLHSRLDAIEKLARHIAFYEKDTEVHGQIRVIFGDDDQTAEPAPWTEDR